MAVTKKRSIPCDPNPEVYDEFERFRTKQEQEQKQSYPSSSIPPPLCRKQYWRAVLSASGCGQIFAHPAQSAKFASLPSEQGSFFFAKKLRSRVRRRRA